MEELLNRLKIALADTFAFYLKTHNFHWNVEGPNFSEYHKFLDDLYNEVWGAVDSIAEHIRAQNGYAPGSFSRYTELSTISDETTVPSAMQMLKILEQDNMKVISSLTSAYEIANSSNKLGLANFIQDRIDIHEKHGWMLRSFTRDE